MGNKPTITLRQVRKKLRKLGFCQIRSSKHEIWENDSGRIVILSHSSQDVGPILLKSICSQAGISVDLFLSL